MDITASAMQYMESHARAPKFSPSERRNAKIGKEIALGRQLYLARLRMGYGVFGPWLRAGNALGVNGRILTPARAYRLMALAGGYEYAMAEKAMKAGA